MNAKLMHPELCGGKWTHQHVETGHQVKKGKSEILKMQVFCKQLYLKLYKSGKVNHICTTAQESIAPGIQCLLFLPLSPLWSHFLALRTVFTIYSKYCCQSPNPFGRRKGTKPPTTPLLSTKDSTPTVFSFLGFGQ